jgi:DNA-binding ferritin-like protein
MGMIVTSLLTLHNQVKIFHWQTKSYAQHQALGGVYDELTDLIDEFVEVFMGKYGRIKADGGFTLKLENYSDGSPTSMADEYVNYLTNELPKSLDVEKDTDLLNIRDEMLGQLNKLKYLLTLS